MAVDIKSLNKDGSNIVITDRNGDVKLSASPYSTQIGLESSPRDLIVTNKAYYSDVKETERIVPLNKGLVSIASTFDAPSGSFIQPTTHTVKSVGIIWLDPSTLPDGSILTKYTVVYTRKTANEQVQVDFGRAESGTTDALSSLFQISAPAVTGDAVSLESSDTFSHEIDYSKYSYFLKVVGKNSAAGDQAHARIINIHLHYKGGDF